MVWGSLNQEYSSVGKVLTAKPDNLRDPHDESRELTSKSSPLSSKGVCLNVCVPYVSIHACECVHVWLHAAHQHICVYVWLCVSALYVSAHDFWVHVCVYTTGWMSGYCECLGTSVFPVRILTEFTYFFLWRVLEDWCEFTLARSLREVEYYTPWYSRNIHSVRLLYLCVMWPFLGRCQ